jgi:eukaryotic-like serine/threonine-protein kinase
MGEPGDDDDHNDDQIFSGPALGEDGALRLRDTQPMFLKIPPSPGEEISPPPGAPPPPAGPASPVLEPIFQQDLVPKSNFQEAPPLQLASVELAERAPRPEPDFTPLPPPEKPLRPPSPDIRWGRWLLLLSLLAIVGGGIFIVTTARATVDKLLGAGGLDRFLPRPTRPGEPAKPGEGEPGAKEKRVGTPAPSLLVLSEPSGATVLVGGAVVGTTPWAGDNVWPKGPLRVELRKPGYRAWETTVEGSAERTVDATLRRK